MTSWLGRRLAWGSILVALGLSAGCGTNVAEEVALAKLDESCQLNSDCQAPLACVFGRCHEACQDNRDCKGGARCVLGQEGTHVCQLPRERSCRSPADCAGSQTCGVDAQCHDACEDASQCVEEQLCSAGACADPSELDEQGMLPRKPRGAGQVAVCELDSDCLEPLVCRSGGCYPECDAGSPCLAGSSCQQGVCIDDAAKPECLRHSDCPEDRLCRSGTCQERPAEPECRYDSDCDVLGQHCLDGTCECECSVDTDCSGGRSCDDACSCGDTVRGNVYISNSDQVRALANVVKIEGQLSMWAEVPLLVELPNLRHVDSVFVGGVDTVFSAENLTDVPGELSCMGDCRLPSLQHAGNVIIAPSNSERKLEVELPALQTALDLKVENGTPGSPYYKSPQLTRLSLPSLWQLQSLKLYGNQDLFELDLSALQEVGDVTVDTNSRLRSLTMPLARAMGLVFVSQNTKLDSIELGCVSPASVDIDRNSALTRVSFPAMTSTTAFRLVDSSQVSTVELPLLQSLTSLEYRNSGGPEIWVLPALHTVETTTTLHGVGGIRKICAPHFTKTSSLTIGITSLRTVELPLGRPPAPEPGKPAPLSPAVESIQLNGNSELERVAFLELRTLTTGLSMNGNTKLGQFEAPLLTTVGALSSQACGKLPACDVWRVLEHVVPSITPTLSGLLCPCERAECLLVVPSITPTIDELPCPCELPECQ